VAPIPALLDEPPLKEDPDLLEPARAWATAASMEGEREETTEEVREEIEADEEGEEEKEPLVAPVEPENLEPVEAPENLEPEEAPENLEPEEEEEEPPRLNPDKAWMMAGWSWVMTLSTTCLSLICGAAKLEAAAINTRRSLEEVMMSW